MKPSPCDLATIETALKDLPSAPIESSRGRSWNGLTLDLYSAGRQDFQSRPRDHHVVILCHTGQSRLIQRRLGRVHDAILGAGTSILLPAGNSGGWEGEAPASARLRVPVNFLDEAAAVAGHPKGDEVPLLDVFATRDTFIERIGRLLMDELERPPHPSQQLIVSAASCAFGAHLVRCYDRRTTPTAHSAPALSAKTMAKVVSYIEDNLDRSINLTDIASIADVSRFHFVRIFKRQMGLTPMAYLEQARINRAMEMIRRGAQPLTDIALLTGFADQSHFTRRFRRQSGLTPTQYARVQGVPTVPRRRP